MDILQSRFCRYLQLLGLVPTDPHILRNLGQIFDSEGDKQQAYQYYFDVRNKIHLFRVDIYVCFYLGSLIDIYQVTWR